MPILNPRNPHDYIREACKLHKILDHRQATRLDRMLDPSSEVFQITVLTMYSMMLDIIPSQPCMLEHSKTYLTHYGGKVLVSREEVQMPDKKPDESNRVVFKGLLRGLKDSSEYI